MPTSVNKYDISLIEKSIERVIDSETTLALTASSHMFEFAFGLPYGPHGNYPNPPCLPPELYKAFINMCENRGWVAWHKSKRVFNFALSKNKNHPSLDYSENNDIKNFYNNSAISCGCV